jgi:hypothetical protein
MVTAMTLAHFSIFKHNTHFKHIDDNTPSSTTTQRKVAKQIDSLKTNRQIHDIL